MPYKLRKAPNRNLYWVITIETKKKHSREPIPLEKAKAQMRILESALVGGGPFKDELAARLSPYEQSIKDAVYAQYEPQLDAIKSGVNFFKGRFFKDEAKREQKRAIIEAAIADAKEVQDRINRQKIETDQENYRALPYRRIPKGTIDPITLNPIDVQGQRISTITERERERNPKTFFFEKPTLKTWEERQIEQGRLLSNPLTNSPYGPGQKRDVKAQAPGRKPVVEFINYMGLEFPKVSVPGRGKYESAPTTTPVGELEGEGRRRGKRKCKKCGKLKK